MSERCHERKSAALIVITFSASAKQALRESGGNHVSRSFVYEQFKLAGILIFRKRSGTISEGARLVCGTDEGPLP
jgi:hypothetical protein